MTVYVDALRDWGWKFGPSCHLIADTNEELHAFAERIGLKRRWFQAKFSGKHYDLTASKRILAIKEGAVELDDFAFHTILKAQRSEVVAALEATDDESRKAAIRAHFFR